MKLETVKAVISFLFFFSLILDFVSTNICLALGFFEQNILFYVLSPLGFWLLYWVASTALFLLLLKFNKYSFVLMVIPLVVHTICGVNNFGLIV